MRHGRCHHGHPVPMAITLLAVNLSTTHFNTYSTAGEYGFIAQSYMRPLLQLTSDFVHKRFANQNFKESYCFIKESIRIFMFDMRFFFFFNSQSTSFADRMVNLDCRMIKLNHTSDRTTRGHDRTKLISSDRSIQLVNLYISRVNVLND